MVSFRLRRGVGWTPESTWKCPAVARNQTPARNQAHNCANPPVLRRKAEVWIAYILRNAKVITGFCEANGKMYAEDDWYNLRPQPSLWRNNKRLPVPVVPRTRTPGNPKVTSKLRNWTQIPRIKPTTIPYTDQMLTWFLPGIGKHPTSLLWRNTEYIFNTYINIAVGNVKYKLLHNSRHLQN